MFVINTLAREQGERCGVFYTVLVGHSNTWKHDDELQTGPVVKKLLLIVRMTLETMFRVVKQL